MADEGLWSKLEQTWPARAAKGLWEGLMLPGDAYQGNVSMYGEDGRTNPQVINRATDLAGVVTGGSYLAPAMKDATGMGIRAYHGSPHDFNFFDTSKIGTGEGAQTYGHGLYFAEKEATARSYRDKLAASDKGKMYEVDINADPAHFLDWDKPLSQQHPQTLEAVKQTMGPNWEQFKSAKAGDAVKQGFIAPGEEATASQLRAAGIPGIKYLDQGSRAAGEGSRNYVVFDNKIIDLMRKYGLAGATPLATGLGLDAMRED